MQRFEWAQNSETGEEYERTTPTGRFVHFVDAQAEIVKLETALAAANERIAQRDRQIDAFNSGGFADADAMAEKYLDLRIENDKFKQALADIQEIADRETSAEHRLLEEIIQCSMDALAVPGARTSS